MANTVHQGEKIAFVGTLTSGQQVTTDYGLVCQIWQYNRKIQEIPCTVDSTNNTYYGIIETGSMLGDIFLRFVAKTASGDIIVSNQDIQKTILQ